ncbi:MAG TPA: penicillin-binding transpeptidase domain-containing protein [Cellulomonas sp.]
MTGRVAGAAVVLALVVVPLAACSSAPPEDQALADALAAALASGDFTDVPLDGATADEATAQRAATYAELDPWTPAVSAGTVAEEKDGTVTVDLSFVWDVDSSGTDWTYTTHATLAQEDGAWVARWSPFLLAPDLTADETLVVTRVQAERADVLGADGSVLVESRPVHRIGIDKTRVTAAEWDGAARGLAQALGLDQDEYAAQVAAAGEKAFVEAIVVRDSDPGYDIATLSALPGVNALSDELPLAPTREFARQVLGTVGQATAEIIDGSDGAVVAGDLTGLSGLQLQYDEQLRGTPGLTISATTGDAHQRQLFHVEPQAGTPLQTTIDPALQQAAEEQVATITDRASAVVAIRPSTGEVLAVASGAGGGGISTATLGLYPPGSTFKVVSSLALLRAGLTPDSTVTCPATATIDGREFSNVPGYPTDRLGDITLQTAVANSCNTAFLTAADLAPQSALVTAAESLGLGQDVDLGFSATLGTVPADSTGTEHAASMIGQGQVVVSPLGMATVAASVVAGSRVTPQLVVQDDLETPAAPAQALTSDEAAALRQMMRAVVTEGGATFLQDVPGDEVLAKSGTAQFGSDDDLQNHTWMIAAQGDLAVAVFVETGVSGVTTAGPLLEAFLDAAAGA